MAGPEKRRSNPQIGARPIISLLFLPLAFTYHLPEFSNALFHPLGLCLEILEIFFKLYYDLRSSQEVPGASSFCSILLSLELQIQDSGNVPGYRYL